jgi:hypothetical protein
MSISRNVDIAGGLPSDLAPWNELSGPTSQLLREPLEGSSLATE